MPPPLTFSEIWPSLLCMNNYVQHICRVAYFHIHCIGRIRNLLERKTTEIVTFIDLLHWHWELPAVRHFRPSSHQTPNSTKLCCPSHNQNEETWPHHCCSGRPSLASDQTMGRVQTATVDVSKPSRHSCSIFNRPINSLPADPCAMLCGRSHAWGAMMQATYTGRNKLLLHASGTICHLPCVPRTASVRSKSN